MTDHSSAYDMITFWFEQKSTEMGGILYGGENAGDLCGWEAVIAGGVGARGSSGFVLVTVVVHTTRFRWCIPITLILQICAVAKVQLYLHLGLPHARSRC